MERDAMRILVIGATGTIGKPIVHALAGRHEVLSASRRSTPLKVDIADRASIAALFEVIGRVDAIVCAAGEARFRPLANLTDEDFNLSLRSKLLGQVNVARLGAEYVTDRGSITLTSGILARHPSPGSAAVSLVNAGLEGFVRAAALEMRRGVRVNIVSPGWVTETLEALHMDPKQGTPAAVVALAYLQAMERTGTGQVIEVGGGN
jgi:NAD(P)-dependent dehydrogenase (short-subunit alcohol dehydrogenase family)